MLLKKNEPILQKHSEKGSENAYYNSNMIKNYLFVYSAQSILNLCKISSSKITHRCFDQNYCYLINNRFPNT